MVYSFSEALSTNPSVGFPQPNGGFTQLPLRMEVVLPAIISKRLVIAGLFSDGFVISPPL